VIAVTCRNGEHFSVDPMSIERVEKDPDVVVHLVDGTKYVIGETFDQLMRTIRDHRATVVVAQKRLGGGVAEYAENAKLARRTTVRIERRAYTRDADHPGDPADRAPGNAPGSTED
jgi:flagellar protein FlbD